MSSNTFTFRLWFYKNYGTQATFTHASPDLKSELVEVSKQQWLLTFPNRATDLLAYPQGVLGLRAYERILHKHAYDMRLRVTPRPGGRPLLEDCQHCLEEIRAFGMWTRHQQPDLTTSAVEQAIVFGKTAVLLGGMTPERRQQEYREHKRRTRHPRYGDMVQTLLETPNLDQRVALFTLLLFTSGMERMVSLRL